MVNSTERRRHLRFGNLSDLIKTKLTGASLSTLQTTNQSRPSFLGAEKGRARHQAITKRSLHIERSIQAAERELGATWQQCPLLTEPASSWGLADPQSSHSRGPDHPLRCLTKPRKIHVHCFWVQNLQEWGRWPRLFSEGCFLYQLVN